MTDHAPFITSDFYVTGGTLRRDAACYVVRRADGELHDALKQGKFCYVLTARQMGMSSLMVRTAPHTAAVWCAPAAPAQWKSR